MANFKFDVDADGIALVTWDMAGRSMNVITMDVIAELNSIVEKVAADAAVKGAVITSGKDAFCGGADLTMLERMGAIFADTVARPRRGGRRRNSCSTRAASCRSSIAASKPAASRGSARSTAPRWAAASSSRSPAISASPPTIRRRGSACPRSRSACSPAPAAPSASRACCRPPTRCNFCSRATSSSSTAPRR